MSSETIYPSHKNHKFILWCSCVICKKEITTQSLDNHISTHYKPSKICPLCLKEHRKDGVFCSRSCANKRTQSLDSNEKRSNTLKNKPQLFTKVSQCVTCGKWFEGRRKTCSENCREQSLVKAGKKSAAIICKRSKEEVELYNLCNNYFDLVDHNKPIFNGWDADIIIYDINLAILWNGPWHYREMNFGRHSLKQVQNRDKIKIKEIKNMGWEVIIFEDRYFTPKEAFKALLYSSTKLPRN